MKTKKHKVGFSAVSPRLRVSLFLSLAFVACHSSDSNAPSDTPDGAPPCTFTGDADGDIGQAPRHTPRWAFMPWISKDISDTDDTYAFVKGFKDRGIPVGTVVLDSPWETNYNTFVPNPTRYHDFAKLVTDMHADGVRVVVWTTQMVNTSSFDAEPGGDAYVGGSPAYDEGAACRFFVGEDDATYFWWKGRGAAVDFTNAKARAWWHHQQDNVLSLGIDGYKLDFGENYITDDPMASSIGPISRQTYSEAYYRDFLAYAVKQRGPDFTTMVRGWDVSYGFPARTYARKEDAPVIWAGDNRRDWVGLADALHTIFTSAQDGYVVVGSDIGGYLGFDDRDVSHKIPFDTEVFARWTAMGALTPFMQLHGQANITPWTVPDHVDEIVDVYKTYATLHTSLIPLFYSLAEEAYGGAAGIVRPVGDASTWDGDYRFMVGDALFVAPIVTTGGTRDVALPEGARFYDWWHPEKDAVAGGTTIAKYDATDWHVMPLFVREGAILPMDDGDARTILVYPSAAASRFVIHDAVTTEITAKVDGGVATLTASRWGGGSFKVRTDVAATAVTIDGAAVPIATSGDPAAPSAIADATTRTLRIKLAARETPTTITVK